MFKIEIIHYNYHALDMMEFGVMPKMIKITHIDDNMHK